MKYASNVRFIAVFSFFMVGYGVILFALFRIQIQHHHFFAHLALKQHSQIIKSLAPRACIYDRTGQQVLALNRTALAACIFPHQCTNKDEVVSFLKKHFPSAAERFATIGDSSFFYIQRRLSAEDQKIIEASGLEAIQLIKEDQRFYPIESAGTIVGITDIDNKGLFGIEGSLNERLAGKPTTCTIERDARSGLLYFNKQVHDKGTGSQSVTLTIDGILQFVVHDELKKYMPTVGATEAAALVINPQTGDILSLVSLPDFNPNDTHELDMACTKNRAITERYELGSVLKIFVALAALSEKITTLDEIIDCKNVKTAYVAGRKVNTVKENGAIPFWQVIADSNNIGTAQIATRLDTKLYDHYRQLGFADKINIGISGQPSGYINPPSLWSKQSIMSLSYGYEVSITILHLARAFCMIANNGLLIEPRLILDPAQKRPEPRQLYDADVIDEIQSILEKTTQEGTARRARIKGYRVMCKTGTANLLVDGVYRPDINLFTCTGIIEKNGYQRVVVTFLKAPGAKRRFSSAVVVPIFEHITEKVLIHDKIW